MPIRLGGVPSPKPAMTLQPRDRVVIAKEPLVGQTGTLQSVGEFAAVVLLDQTWDGIPVLMLFAPREVIDPPLPAAE